MPGPGKPSEQEWVGMLQEEREDLRSCRGRSPHEAGRENLGTEAETRSVEGMPSPEGVRSEWRPGWGNGVLADELGAERGVPPAATVFPGPLFPLMNDGVETREAPA